MTSTENEFDFEEKSSSKAVEEEQSSTDVSLPMETTNNEEQISLPMEITQQEEETNVTSSKKFHKIKQISQSNLDQSVIIEGKRSRKPTARLELTESVPTKKALSIPQGHGTPLGEIEYINYQLAHASTDALMRMHQICFGRRGKEATIRKILRKFQGFDFNSQSSDYKKHLNNLTKLKKEQLRSLSNILGLSLTGRNIDLAENILNFLLKPIDEGKKLRDKKSKKKHVLKSNENSKTFNFKPGKTLTNKRRSDDEVEDSNDVKRQKGLSNSDEEKTIENVV